VTTTTRVHLGAMNFGGRTPEAESMKMIHRAIERGVRHIDTANSYGESEHVVGKAIAKLKRDDVVVATKVGFDSPEGKLEGVSRAAILDACERSRRDLGVDAIDLHYLHTPVPETPIEESVDAMGELLAAKKIRAWGISNYAAWKIVEIARHCDARGIARPVMSQVGYNLLVRQLDAEYFPCAKKYVPHTTVFNALAGGLLAWMPGSSDDAPPKGSRFARVKMYRRRYWNPRAIESANAYRKVADDLGTTTGALAYRWLATRPGVDSILIGPGTMEQLDFALDQCALTLDDETMKRIDEIHEMLVGTDARYVR
jgi:aryl-alcohol dehydrogenase-like predicted oxidoreductase